MQFDNHVDFGNVDLLSRRLAGEANGRRPARVGSILFSHNSHLTVCSRNSSNSSPQELIQRVLPLTRKVVGDNVSGRGAGPFIGRCSWPPNACLDRDLLKSIHIGIASTVHSVRLRQTLLTSRAARHMQQVGKAIEIFGAILCFCIRRSELWMSSLN